MNYGEYQYQYRMTAWLLASSLVISLLAGYLLIETAEPARAADGNMILFWDGSGVLPSGWTDISDGGPGDFLDKYIRAGSSYGTTGGFTTHTHTPTYVTEGGGATTPLDPPGPPAMPSAPGHTHGALSAYSVGNGNNEPPFRALRVMEYTDGGVPDTIPNGAIAMFESTSDYGTGWSTYTAQNSYFLYGDNAASVTSIGGSATHNHSFATGLGMEAGFPANGAGGGGVNYGQVNHSHGTGASTNTATDSNEPPFVEVVFAKTTGVDIEDAPVGMMAGFTSSQAIGTEWDFTISESGGTYYQKFLKADSSSPGGTGGDGTSTHTNTTTTSGAPSAVGKNGLAFFPTSPVASPTHTHTVTASWSTDANLPPFKEILLAEYSPPDPTWVTASASYTWRIYQSASTTWNSGTLICSASLTDDNSSTTNCTGGSIAASTQYRVQAPLKIAGSVDAHMDEAADTVTFKNILNSWPGTSPTVGTCGFYDVEGDNTGSTACTAASAGDDVIVFNSGASSDVVIAAGEIEGFYLFITTASDAVTDATSYMEVAIDNVTEDSSKIGVSGPANLGITAPASISLGSANPGTTYDVTFDTDELVTATDGGAGWSISVISTDLDSGSATIDASNIYIRKDGNVVTSDTYTIWSGTTTNVSETAETVSLDTIRSVGTRSSGTGGDTTNVRPSLQIVIPPGTAADDYLGDITFTIA